MDIKPKRSTDPTERYQVWGSEYEGYGEGKTWFLIWREEKWEWVDAEDYEPA